MMYTKICGCCNRVFESSCRSQKYCSKACSREIARKRLLEEDQLCWNCVNACGGCDWSKSFKPIKGWVAEPTIVRDSAGDFSSYRIKKCPEFIRE